jgi:hypothetical protein
MSRGLPVADVQPFFRRSLFGFASVSRQSCQVVSRIKNLTPRRKGFGLEGIRSDPS